MLYNLPATPLTHSAAQLLWARFIFCQIPPRPFVPHSSSFHIPFIFIFHPDLPCGDMSHILCHAYCIHMGVHMTFTFQPFSPYSAPYSGHTRPHCAVFRHIPPYAAIFRDRIPVIFGDIPPYSGHTRPHHAVFRPYSTVRRHIPPCSGHIPSYSVVFRRIPPYSGHTRPHHAVFRPYSTVRRHIPPFSGHIPSYSALFRPYSATSRRIPAVFHRTLPYSGTVFRSYSALFRPYSATSRRIPAVFHRTPPYSALFSPYSVVAAFQGYSSHMSVSALKQPPSVHVSGPTYACLFAPVPDECVTSLQGGNLNYAHLVLLECGELQMLPEDNKMANQDGDAHLAADSYMREYLDEMRKPETPGGRAELAAFGELLSCGRYGPFQSPLHGVEQYERVPRQTGPSGLPVYELVECFPSRMYVSSAHDPGCLAIRCSNDFQNEQLGGHYTRLRLVLLDSNEENSEKGALPVLPIAPPERDDILYSMLLAERRGATPVQRLTKTLFAVLRTDTTSAGNSYTTPLGYSLVTVKTASYDDINGRARPTLTYKCNCSQYRNVNAMPLRTCQTLLPSFAPSPPPLHVILPHCRARHGWEARVYLQAAVYACVVTWLSYP